jgi:two-component system, OmpR family, response regulator ChvI
MALINHNNNHNNIGSSSTRRILLIDDDVDITTSLKIGLEDNGFTVDVFNDPLLALSNFRPGIYDLLITDLIMPNMDGFELYEQAQKIDNKIKACCITAFDAYYEILKEKFPDSHIDCFIKKPFQINDLVKRVNVELGSQ